MDQNEGVFSIMGNTFRLWALYCEQAKLPVNSIFVRHISPSGFVQFVVPVPAQFVEQFSSFIAPHTHLHLGQIDGDVQPASLWMGHWTHFTVRYFHLTPLPDPPKAETQSERFLRRLLNGDIRPKPRRTR